MVYFHHVGDYLTLIDGVRHIVGYCLLLIYIVCCFPCRAFVIADYLIVFDVNTIGWYRYVCSYRHVYFGNFCFHNVSEK